MHKLGTLESDTNFVPWRDYTPSRQWLISLYDSQKLTDSQFLNLSLEFPIGHAERKRDALDVARDRYEKILLDHVATERAALDTASPATPVHLCPSIHQFVQSFSSSARRRPLLLLVGGTQLGKSMLAQQVLKKIGDVLGLTDFLEVTVEDNADLDLSLFRVHEHSGVLLDGIGDIIFLKKHREALQGRTKVCRGGRSATMM